MSRRATPRAVQILSRALAEALESRVLLSAAPYLVANIGDATASSFPQFGFEVSGSVYFWATQHFFSGPGGLWKSDGTAAGTTLVSSAPTIAPGFYAPLNGQVLFASNGGLWRTDGTPAGTSMLIGTTGTQIQGTNLVNFDGAVYFTGLSPTQPLSYGALWRTDGTTAGTYVVQDFTAPYTGVLETAGLVAAGGDLYFIANAGNGQEGLYKSDGTAGGTVLLKAIQFGNPDQPQSLTAMGNDVYFTNGDASGDSIELWRSDGTANGTQVVGGGTGGFYGVYDLTVVGNTLFYAADNGQVLCKITNTNAGSTVVAQVGAAGQADSMDSLAAAGNRLFFVANDGTHGFEVWTSDGTAAGTGMVKDINPGVNNSIGPQSGIMGLGTEAFFYASDASGTSWLWKSDGTAAGTVPLMQLQSDPNGAHLNTMPFLGVLGGQLLFRGNDGLHDAELWRTDGTVSGTAMVADIDTDPAGSSPEDLFNYDGTLLFYADDRLHGRELWRSDGTAAGTQLVKDINPGPNSSIAGWGPQFTEMNGLVYFFATDGASVQELWRTDGTANGTVLVKDIFPGSRADGVDHLVTAGSALYFIAFGNSATGLWKSDGTTGGTVLLQTATPSSMASVGGRLVYVAHGPQVWAGDGTLGDQLLFYDPQTVPEFNHSSVLNGELYFNGAAPGTGQQPWVTDGTPQGTRQLADLGGSGGSFPQTFTAIGNHVFFIATGQSFSGLWETDGTAAGTVYAGIPVGGNPANASASAALDPTNGANSPYARLFFQPVVGTPYATLWILTGDGAVEVNAFGNGSTTWGPTHPCVVGDKLFFQTSSPTSGPELWAFNIGGSVTGTVFNDANGNGTRDGNEPGLAGVTVYLDTNENGHLDPGEPSTVTDASGNYVFPDPPIGEYLVRQVLPAGYVETTFQENSRRVLIAAGSTNTTPFADERIDQAGLGFNYLLTLAQHYGQSGTFSTGDLNDDGQVNFDDLLILAQNYSQSSPPAVAAGTDALQPMNARTGGARRRRA